MYPYPTDGPERNTAIGAAEQALQRLTTLLRTCEVAEDEGFFALGAVTVGMYRSLDTLRLRPQDPAAQAAELSVDVRHRRRHRDVRR